MIVVGDEEPVDLRPWVNDQLRGIAMQLRARTGDCLDFRTALAAEIAMHQALCAGVNIARASMITAALAHDPPIDLRWSPALPTADRWAQEIGDEEAEIDDR